jgi:hypothetical protein
MKEVFKDIRTLCGYFTVCKEFLVSLSYPFFKLKFDERLNVKVAVGRPIDNCY